MLYIIKKLQKKLPITQKKFLKKRRNNITSINKKIEDIIGEKCAGKGLIACMYFGDFEDINLNCPRTLAIKYEHSNYITGKNALREYFEEEDLVVVNSVGTPTFYIEKDDGTYRKCLVHLYTKQEFLCKFRGHLFI